MATTPDQFFENVLQNCLRRLGLARLIDWDVLTFIYRHRASLVSAEQIARLVGYSHKTVSEALERLESQGIIKPSRSLQGVRFYALEDHLVPDSCFRQLISLAENRTGRLLLVRYLQPSGGLHLAEKRKENEPKQRS